MVWRRNIRVELVGGSLGDLGGDTESVGKSTAAAHGWHVGDTLAATVGTLSTSLTVGGAFQDSPALGSPIIVDRAVYSCAVPAAQQVDGRSSCVPARPRADWTSSRPRWTRSRPPSRRGGAGSTEFPDEQCGAITTVLGLLYVLLLFSVVIAVLGVVNTLTLLVLERTREIGLQRVVGLGRGQLRGTITIEAVTTALFGAFLGTGLGLGLDIALQRGLWYQGLTTLGISWTLVLAMLVGSVRVTSWQRSPPPSAQLGRTSRLP